MGVAGLRTTAQVRHHALEVGHGLLVHGDPGRTRVDEGVEVAVGVLDHEVDVEGQRRGPAQRLHDGRAQGDVGDEVPVHHVHVQDARPAAGGGGHLLGQAREVGGQDRGGEDHGPPWLTSRPIEVWGLTR